MINGRLFTIMFNPKEEILLTMYNILKGTTPVFGRKTSISIMKALVMQDTYYFSVESMLTIVRDTESYVHTYIQEYITMKEDPYMLDVEEFAFFIETNWPKPTKKDKLNAIVSKLQDIMQDLEVINSLMALRSTQ